ncbi:hypothetical protein H5P28_16285 [Ruficoccus amylovorans]|uniref:Uncharacterized protein n=1 Tax=Ruficoccus amylovorans TaxID=1804625 RepID=A0A842HGJ9_9BACT|nr:hypothetical protein [Ruficoccus amylovorans]MBC2595825.1 hypothetical protein [Ruficoccus amylovorans]
MFRWFPIVFLCLTTPLLGSNALKKINYGQRSSLEDDKAEFDVQKPEMSTQFGGTKMDLTQWHSQFSTLGQKKSSLLTGGNRFSGEQIEYSMQDKKLKNTNMAPGNRSMAQMRNWNSAMDTVMANKFQMGEVTAPAGRKMQNFIDDVNLRDINRYMFANNKTEDGIPVQRAGEGALNEIPTQMRDRGRIVAPDSEEGDPSRLFRNPFQRNGSEAEAEE